MRYGVASVEGVFLVVLLTEYWAPSVVAWYNETKITVFQPGILLPIDLKALMSHCMLLTLGAFREGDCHILRYLLEMSAWYGCVCQLFHYANFSGSLYRSFTLNSSALCLVWISGGTVWEVPEEKGVWASVVKILLSESLPGGCSIISAARGATEIFKASCWT